MFPGGSEFFCSGLARIVGYNNVSAGEVDVNDR